MQKRNRSGNPLGIAVGAIFVAILLIAGVVTSQAAGRNSPPAHEQAYVETR